MNNSEINARRKQAQQLQHAGDYAKAVEIQVSIINARGGYSIDTSEDMHLLGLYLFQLGDMQSATLVLRQVLQLAPANVEVAKNLAICELKLGNHQSALSILTDIEKRAPDNYEIQDVLAHAAGLAGDMALAIKHGCASLQLKDQAVCEGNDKLLIIESKPKMFEFTNPDRNIISFSLWGNQAKYLDGAVQNARLANDIYPGWCCRFYIDESVPVATKSRLRDYGAQIVEMPQAEQAFDGLFWRFLVADDPNVDRFIIRDCDAIINIRERAAVDLWCQSTKHFHAMRDFYTHTELILAGMWGGIAGVLPNISKLAQAFKTTLQLRTRIIDQLFLRQEIWPRIKNHLLIHDSIFNTLHSVDFPPYATLPAGQHVGQDITIFS